MKKPSFFLIVKLFLFILVTIFSLNIMYYFPNLPPTFRLIIKKGVIVIQDDENSTVDKRFLTWFDRDPERQIPDDPGLIVSPADGVVQCIDRLEGNQHVVIEMRYTDVHVQRVPLQGKVIAIEGGGKKLPKGVSPYTYTLKKMLPYQKRITFDTEIGWVAVRQITSLFASRIDVFLQTGEEVKRGQRLGRVLAGSTIVLELPMHIKVLVKNNQEVVGGETIIAKY